MSDISQVTDRLQRFLELVAEPVHTLSLSGLNQAFAACLSYEEACEALLLLFDGGEGSRDGVLARLLRNSSEVPRPEHLDRVADRLLLKAKEGSKARVRANAILWQIFDHLSVDAQHRVIDAWRTDTRKDAKARWLKVADVDDRFIEQVLSYWRESRDPTAAKIVAYRADPNIVAAVLPELIEHCDEGWIIGRAGVRASEISPDTVRQLKDKFPATYCYVSAKRGWPIPHDEAIRLVLRVRNDSSRDQRGLIVWSIGQLGMWDTLEEIRKLGPTIEQRDAEAFLARHRLNTYSGHAVP